MDLYSFIYFHRLDELQYLMGQNDFFMEMLEGIFFGDFRETIKNAYNITNNITVTLYARNMKIGGNKPQREYLVSTLNVCKCIIDNKEMILDIMKKGDDELIYVMVKLLSYDKDFITKIFYGSTLTGENKILVSNDTRLKRDEGLIIKINTLFMLYKNIMEQMQSGINYIFELSGMKQIGREKAIYLIKLFQTYKKINEECAEYLEQILNKEIKDVANGMCNDDALAECKCKELKQCGKYKLCPENFPANHDKVCTPIISGGANYFNKYRKYKLKYMKLKTK